MSVRQKCWTSHVRKKSATTGRVLTVTHIFSIDTVESLPVWLSSIPKSERLSDRLPLHYTPPGSKTILVLWCCKPARRFASFHEKQSSLWNEWIMFKRRGWAQEKWYLHTWDRKDKAKDTQMSWKPVSDRFAILSTIITFNPLVDYWNRKQRHVTLYLLVPMTFKKCENYFPWCERHQGKYQILRMVIFQATVWMPEFATD